MHATGHASLRQNGSQEMVIGNATYLRWLCSDVLDWVLEFYNLRSDISVIASNVGHFEVLPAVQLVIGL